MTEVVADLFAEDEAHESFCKPLVCRIAEEVGLRLAVNVRRSAGGAGRALEDVDAYLRALDKGLERPHVLCIVIDANCHGHADRRRELQRKFDTSALGIRAAFLCPDPHIECWYLADPSAVAKVLKGPVALPAHKCQRALYKRLLQDAVKAAGRQPILGGVEFGKALVREMDLYQAGKAVPSLGAAIAEVRQCFKALQTEMRQGRS